MIDWTDEKNARRCKLIDKEIYSSITQPEQIELDSLQQQVWAYRQMMAPLDIEGAREALKKMKDK